MTENNLATNGEGSIAAAAAELAEREGFSLRTAYRRLRMAHRCRACGTTFAQARAAAEHAAAHLIESIGSGQVPAAPVGSAESNPAISKLTDFEVASSIAIARATLARLERELEARASWRVSRPRRAPAAAPTSMTLTPTELSILGLVAESPTSGLAMDWRLERRPGLSAA